MPRMSFIESILRFFKTSDTLASEITRIQNSIADEKRKIADRETARVIEDNAIIERMLANKDAKIKYANDLRLLAIYTPTNTQHDIYRQYRRYELHDSANCPVHYYDYSDASMEHCNCHATVKYTNGQIYDAMSKVKSLLRRNRRTRLFQEQLRLRFDIILEHLSHVSLCGDLIKLINAFV